MTRPQRTPFSYRDDPSVPAWDDGSGLIVFDGHCVLCSGFVQFVLRHDTAARFRFTMALSGLGQALYRHYRLDPQEFETNLVIVNGRLYEKLATVIAILETLGGPWRVASALRLLPVPLANWLYGRIARNRYRLFGRYDACMAPSTGLQTRLIE